MKVIILGSGTLKSGAGRNPAGYLLNSEGDFALLDCGPGILRQLNQLHTDTIKINTVFLSHFHLDHCADLFPLLLNRYLQDNTANRNLTIYGPSGLNAWYRTISRTQGKWLHGNEPNVIEISENHIMWHSWIISTVPNGHTENCLCYRFDNDRSIFYSSDMEYNQELTAFARNADLGIIECSRPDLKSATGHMTPASCGRFARESGIKKLIATHIYPENDTEDLKDRIADHFSGEIIIASDFMELVLG